jgi:hypothetical protein
MPENCEYNGSSYSDGSSVCQAGEVHRCDDGSWTNLHYSCDDVVDEPVIKGFEITDSEADTFRDDARSVATGASASCPVNSPINTNLMLRGTHSYSLRNTTAQSAVYTVVLRLADDKGHQFEETRHETVAAGGAKSGSGNSFLQVAYGASEIGVVRVTATTRVSGPESDSATGSCSFSVFRP